MAGWRRATVVGAVIYVTMDRFLLHRPTVSTSSLQKFGLRGPAPMSRSEWTAAESERDGKNAPLLGGEGAAGEELRDDDKVAAVVGVVPKGVVEAPRVLVLDHRE